MSIMSETVLEFSILIVAFDRREYILEAVNSALSQQFDRDKFEIIVIKNYKDETIDNYLREHQIKSIYSEETALGAKFFEGAKSASGKYLCLLEDDDRFMPEKISAISNFVEEGTIFIHNSFLKRAGERREVNYPELISMDAGEFKLRQLLEFTHHNASFNCSSITVERNIIIENKDVIRNLTYHLDSFLYLASLSQEKGKIIHLNQPLTIFRSHDDSVLMDFDNFISKRLSRSLSVLNEMETYRLALKDKIPRFLLVNDFLYVNSIVRLLGEEPSTRKLSPFDYFAGLFPWPPTKTYLFKMKTIVLSFLPERQKIHFLRKLYNSTKKKYEKYDSH